MRKAKISYSHCIILNFYHCNLIPSWEEEKSPSSDRSRHYYTDKVPKKGGGGFGRSMLLLLLSWKPPVLFWCRFPSEISGPIFQKASSSSHIFWKLFFPSNYFSAAIFQFSPSGTGSVCCIEKLLSLQSINLLVRVCVQKLLPASTRHFCNQIIVVWNVWKSFCFFSTATKYFTISPFHS